MDPFELLFGPTNRIPLTLPVTSACILGPSRSSGLFAFVDSIFPRSVIQPFRANAAWDSNESRTAIAKEQENSDRCEQGRPGTSRADQDQSAVDPQACPLVEHHPSPRRRPYPVAEDASNRHVEADGLTLAEPLPPAGCLRNSARIPPEAGPQAGAGGEGRGNDRTCDAAAGARQPLDVAGAGREAGDRGLDGVRHPEAHRLKPHRVKTFKVLRTRGST